MRSEEEIGQVRELIRKVGSFHEEITPLARKSPDNPISKFKIKLVNELISAANAVLDDNRPFESFDRFDDDLLPTTSDLTTILAQYREALVQYHNDSRVRNASGEWVYKIGGKLSSIKADWIPAKIK